LNALVLEGKSQQNVTTSLNIAIKDLIIKNENNPVITGNLSVTGNLHFDQGKVITGDGGLLMLEAGAIISGYGEQRFVEGPLGIKNEKCGPRGKDLPVGNR
jgi:hypothetical protein